MVDEQYDYNSVTSNANSHRYPDSRVIAIRQVSWGAIFAGGIIVLAVWITLTLLGTSIGLGIAHPSAGASDTNVDVGIGGTIWWFVTGLFSLGLGGYVAARLAGVTQAMDGVLQGITTWAAVMLVILYLLTSAVGNVVGGAFSVVGGVASVAGQSVKAAVPEVAQASGVSPEQLKATVSDLLENQPPSDPKQMTQKQAVSALVKLAPKLLTGSDEDANQARQRMINIVAAQANISPQEAEQKVNKWEQKVKSTLQQAKQAGKEAANSAASVTSTATLAAFAMLFFGFCAGAAGGAIGRRRPAV